MNEVIKAIKSRRSIRKYKSDAIPEEIIESIVEAGQYAASGMIPIVGNTVASTLATLAGGLALVKSTVGVGAIAVIISLALAPLVSLLLYRLAFTVAIVFLELFGSCDGVRSFSAFRSALDALSAVYSVSVVVCIIEIVIFLKSGGAL